MDHQVEDKEFIKRYMYYLKEIEMDDLLGWTDEEIKFYETVAFPVHFDYKRRSVYDQIMKALNNSPHKKLLMPLFENY